MVKRKPIIKGRKLKPAQKARAVAVKNARKKRQPVAKQNGGRQHLKYLDSLLNPFDNAGCIPDGAAGTGCFSVKENRAMVTGASTANTMGFIVQPNVDNMYLTATSGTDILTWAATWSGGVSDTTVDAQYSTARPISAGIRATYTGSTLNDQGIIIVAQFDSNVYPHTLTNALNVTTAAMWYEIYPLRHGATILWRPTQMNDTRMVRVGTAPYASAGATDVPYIGVFVFNAAPAGASALVVEYIVNLEGKYKLQTFIPGGVKNFASQEPVVSSWYEKTLEVLSKVQPFVPSGSALLNAGANYASTLIGNTLGIPSNKGMLGWH